MADRMLIDGLIKFCDEKSKNIKLKAEPQVFVEIKQALNELKIYKQCNISKTNFAMGYNKAIDEFVKVMKKTYPLAENDLFTINDTLHRTLDKIAEQMKAGGNSDN